MVYEDHLYYIESAKQSGNSKSRPVRRVPEMVLLRDAVPETTISKVREEKL